jgi:hypothetical protein
MLSCGWLLMLLLQHGPIQFGNFSLSFDDFSVEHLIWSQFLQFVHSTAYGPSFFLHTEQYHI